MHRATATQQFLGEQRSRQALANDQKINLHHRREMQVVRRSNDDGDLSETDGVLGALLGHDLLFSPDSDAALDLDEGELEYE